jgi:hypothetical protein
METMLRGAFVQALKDKKFLDEINEGNSWAVVKVAN